MGRKRSEQENITTRVSCTVGSYLFIDTNITTYSSILILDKHNQKRYTNIYFEANYVCQPMKIPYDKLKFIKSVDNYDTF